MRALLAGAILLAAMPAAAHDWYTNTWNSLGGRCCGDKDCRPLTSEEIRMTETGEIEVFVRGTWWPALDPNYFVGASPDGSWHVCALPSERKPRCVFGDMGT